MNTSTFRMSQELASKIASELLTKKYKEAADLKKELSEYVTGLAEKEVPVMVKEVFKKHCEYVETSQNVYLDGNGFSRVYITLQKQIPSTTSNAIVLKLNKTELAHIKKLHHAVEDKNNDNKRIREEIKTALLNLKTFTAIQKDFPEAIPFFPKSNSVALTVNLTKLRNDIK